MADLDYQGYRIVNVFGPKDEDLRAEIVDFWLRNRACFPSSRCANGC